MKKGILIGMGIVGLTVAACKKDNDGKTATTAQLLSSTTWKMDTIQLDTNKDGVADEAVPAGFVESCDLDNTITFNSNGSGTTDEGATKCEDSLAQSTPFSWSLKDGDSTLVIAGSLFQGVSGNVTIKKITNTSLVLIQAVTLEDPFPITVNAIVTLKK